MCKKVIYLITFVGVLGLVIGVANAVPFQQDFGPDGIVSIEAENYDANVPQGGDTWELVGPTGGFTGTAGMQALPNDDAGTRKTNYAARCPRLDYQINFVRTGTHYVWVRGYGASGNDDSCHVGLDGREINTCDNMSGWTNNYTWSNNTLDGQRGTFEVTPAGIHTLNIWMREDGFIIDKIVLTTNVDFTPTGDGPPESVRGQPAQVQAYNPKPAYLATDVPDVLTLSWTPGENAVQHDVYFGTDFNDVNNATVSTASIYRGRQDSNSFLPAEVPLEMKRTYYWRIDEIRSGQPDSPVKGKVWSFTTGDFILVDDFETYNDFCNRIFYTWTDGWGYFSNPDCGVSESNGNGTSSAVGNLMSPFAEPNIVHSGRQSMPFEYANNRAPYYSEIQRQWSNPQDWTRSDVKVLIFWLHGAAANNTASLYVGVEDSSGKSKIIIHDDPNAVKSTTWLECIFPLSQFTDAGVDLSAVKKMMIVVGDKEAPEEGPIGKIYIDDIRLRRPWCRPDVAKPQYDFNNDCVVNEADLELLMEEYGRTLINPATTGEIYREAESADWINDPIQILDDPTASGGRYVSVDIDVKDSSDSPPSDGVAYYDFTVAGGVYKLLFRVSITGGNDSFWVRIQGATTQTRNDASGWVRFNTIEAGAEWHWDEVHSDQDPNSPTVQWTMPAGNYTLEVARRESGAKLDALLLTANLALDQVTLNPLRYDLNGDGKTDDADVTLLMAAMNEQILWP